MKLKKNFKCMNVRMDVHLRMYNKKMYKNYNNVSFEFAAQELLWRLKYLKILLHTYIIFILFRDLEIRLFVKT